jgi:hypothetical protein
MLFALWVLPEIYRAAGNKTRDIFEFLVLYGSQLIFDK